MNLKIIRVCEHQKCGKEFTVRSHGIPKRFCSTDCGYANRKSTPEQLLKKNTKRNSNGCLDLITSTYSNGYGRVSIGNNKHKLAHRFVWELNNGKIPDGLCVLHHCDRPACCEITHLFLGTHADNSFDMMKKGRHNTSFGEQTSSSKLSKENILDIYKQLKQGTTPIELAKEYNVVPETIRRIKRGSPWKYLNLEPLKLKIKSPLGFNRANSKIKKEDIPEILSKARSGLSGRKIAKIYKVSPGLIQRVIHGTYGVEACR